MSLALRLSKEAHTKMKRSTAISDKLVQRINIAFCVKLGWTVPQTTAALQAAHGVNLLSKSRIRHWHRQFRLGRTTLVDLQRRPKTRTGHSQTNIDAVKRVVDGDRRLTVAALSTQTGIPPATVHQILRKDLKLERKCARIVPKLLSPAQLRERLHSAQTMLRAIRRSDKVLKTVVTMDESWMYMYDPELHSQSSQWLAQGEDRPTVSRRPRVVGKSLLVSFFDHKGMVHHEYLRHQRVNSAVFIRILSRLKVSMQNRHPNVKWILHMDNASSHTSRLTRLYMLLTGMRAMPHPPNSPDLAPSNYWLYPHIKKGIRGKWFGSLDELEDAVDAQISSIGSHEYSDCILHQWPMRWSRCVFRHGAYFEGLH